MKDHSTNKGKVFKVRAFISDIVHSDKNYYLGCSDCRRKVKGDIAYKYKCYYCQKEHERPFYFYSFVFKGKYNTGECILDVIGASGDVIFGRNADTYRENFIENEDKEFQKL